MLAETTRSELIARLYLRYYYRQVDICNALNISRQLVSKELIKMDAINREIKRIIINRLETILIDVKDLPNTERECFMLKRFIEVMSNENK